MFKLIPKLRSALEHHAFCILCGSPCVSDFCSGCYSDLPWNNRACRRCALPLPGRNQVYCASCSKNPFTFDYAIAGLRYEFPVDAVIRRFKYSETLYLARPLAKLLVARIRDSELPLPDAILPVPLHMNRFKERGFNQSLEIARHIAKKLKVPLTDCVERQRDTPHQSGLNAKQRRKNLRLAFSLTQKKLPQSVAIVDDVMTTGTTVNTISKLLRRHGVTEIQAWCIARAGGC